MQYWCLFCPALLSDSYDTPNLICVPIRRYIILQPGDSKSYIGCICSGDDRWYNLCEILIDLWPVWGYASMRRLCCSYQWTILACIELSGEADSVKCTVAGKRTLAQCEYLNPGGFVGGEKSYLPKYQQLAPPHRCWNLYGVCGDERRSAFFKINAQAQTKTNSSYTKIVIQKFCYRHSCRNRWMHISLI